MRRIAALILVAWPLAAAAPANASVTGDCTAAFNGVDVSIIDALDSPLELDADDTLAFTGTVPAGTASARVTLLVGPVEVDAASTHYAGAATEFTADIDLSDFTPYAVGLYRIRGVADGCEAEAWLRITGRFPLGTLAGLSGAGLALAGIAGQLGAIASRRRFAATGALLAGLLTGSGAAVLAQQFGRLQPSYPALGGCIAAASLLGFMVARLAGRSARDRRRQHLPRQPKIQEPAAQEAFQEPPAPVEVTPAVPFWGYVLSEVDVFDLADHSRSVGALHPGTWYLVKREVGPWVHVAGNPGPEGWAPKHAVNRQG